MNILDITPGDIPEIVAIQDKLILKQKEAPTQGGFLVSAFTAGDYERFLGTFSYFYKAISDDGAIAGVLLGLKSSEIPPGDLNNRLLTEAVRGDCVIVKQVFTDPAAGRKGVGGKLYRHLFRQVEEGIPVVAAVVDDPPNPPSIAFHRKQGFRPFIEFTPDPDRDGITRRRTGWIREPAGVTGIIRPIRTFPESGDGRAGTGSGPAQLTGEGAKVTGEGENTNPGPGQDCGCGNSNDQSERHGASVGAVGVEGAGGTDGGVNGDANGSTDGDADSGTDGGDGGFYPEKPKMDSDRMNALLSLYRHEDNLNWRKLGLQFTIIFTLLAAFFVIDEKGEALPFGNDTVKTVLTLICVGINISFALKIVSGLCYMDRHKKQAVALDEDMEANYRLPSIFRNIKDKSVTSKMIEGLAWTGVGVSCGFLAIALYPIQECFLEECLGYGEGNATGRWIAVADIVVLAAIAVIARYFRRKIKDKLCSPCG